MGSGTQSAADDATQHAAKRSTGNSTHDATDNTYGVRWRLRLVFHLGDGFGNDGGRPHHVFNADMVNTWATGAGAAGGGGGGGGGGGAARKVINCALGKCLRVDQGNQHEHADNDDFQDVSDGSVARFQSPVFDAL